MALEKDEIPLTPTAAEPKAQSILADRQRTEQDLAAVRARLAAVVEASDDAIITKTLDGIISTWNMGAQRMFGYTAQEAIGRPITILIPPERISEEADILNRLRSGERIDHYETVRVRRDGGRLDISLSVSPLRNADGKLVGASKIARDITARRHEHAKLLEAERAGREEAERVSVMKDEFLATLSHELRTPLSAILGWSRILRSDGTTKEELAEGLAAIERNARAQAHLIEDLLDVSRIVSGTIHLDLQPVDLREVLEAAVAAVQFAADAKEIRLELALDPPLGPVRADPRRLRQCFWNLLMNAVKFTPRGGNMWVNLHRIDSHLEVSIVDDGEGIKPEFLPHLFERFRQADASTTRRHGGLGLGLSIVKHLVELHGGSIRGSSAGAGHGSTFCIELPTMPAPSAGEPRRRQPCAAAPAAGSADQAPLEGGWSVSPRNQ